MPEPTDTDILDFLEAHTVAVACPHAKMREWACIADGGPFYGNSVREAVANAMRAQGKRDKDPKPTGS